MIRREISFLLALGALVFVWGCSSSTNNPAQNSVIVTSGGPQLDSWFQWGAEVFLEGKVKGITTDYRYPHCPWVSTGKFVHMEDNFTNAEPYYYDSAYGSSGADNDSKKGIDQAMLFYCATHGNPGGWQVKGS